MKQEEINKRLEQEAKGRPAVGDAVRIVHLEITGIITKIEWPTVHVQCFHGVVLTHWANLEKV